MGGTCNTNGVTEKCKPNFDQKARKEENTKEVVGKSVPLQARGA